MSMLSVFLGGGFGCLVRYLISKGCMHYLKNNLPITTFISNMLSCFLLVVILLWIRSKTDMSSNSIYLFLVVGFCGGLSTFSTFSLETVELIRSGSVVVAFLNVAISILAGFAIIYFLLNKGN